MPLLPPEGLARLPGLRGLHLNAMGLSAWPLPALNGVLPNLHELQVGMRPEERARARDGASRRVSILLGVARWAASVR